MTAPRDLSIPAIVEAISQMDGFSSGGVSVVGVCGPPGAGKSTLCTRLSGHLAGRVGHLIGDRFSRHGLHQREARIEEAAASGDAGAIAYEDNPLNWYHWQAIGEAIEAIRVSRRCLFPFGWNSVTGACDQPYLVSLPTSGPAVLLVDAIHLLHAPVRAWCDRVLLVDTPPDVMLERGRRRGAADPERMAVMERRHARYTVPYFQRFSRDADWVYRPD